MKKTIFLTYLFLSIFFLPTISKAAETVDITFKFKAINTREGFDLTSKLVVYCDGNKIGESTSKLQSKQNSVTVKIPSGNHNVRAVLNALNDAGNWEERTIANEYSLDFVYDKTDYWSSNNTINLTYDIAEMVVNVDEKKDANVVSTTTTSTKTNDYNSVLKKINDYLKTFDDGYYGYLEIKDGYLYDRFKSGKYSKSEIKYLTTAYEEEYKRKVGIKCKDDKDCVYSTYTDSYHKSIGFSQSTDFNTAELIKMLNNLLAVYNGSSNTISTIETYNTTTNNSTALQKINDFLKTFDNGYYGYLEIKDGYL
ncbi:MAG TPA: hypothetical protein PK431_17320, partial [Chitinophagales bacterium]|nr:hypothetical protein [Chitinophagales bacterium]